MLCDILLSFLGVLCLFLVVCEFVACWSVSAPSEFAEAFKVNVAFASRVQFCENLADHWFLDIQVHV